MNCLFNNEAFQAASFHEYLLFHDYEIDIVEFCWLPYDAESSSPGLDFK